MQYRVEDGVPAVERYCYLRKEAGLSPKSEKAAQLGLPHTLIGVVVKDEAGAVIGMGRVIGDGGCSFHIVDVAVLPGHQGKGLGTKIMSRIMKRIEEQAPETAYISMMADVPEFYEKFGFKRSAPHTIGMFKRV